MTIVRTLLAVLALCLAVGAAAAEDSRVSVVFAHPETYTDLKVTCVSRDADARALTDELTRFLQEAGASGLPAGQRLEITLTNVDMAGDIEIWRGVGRCDLRVMRDIYPPRIDLRFTITGADRAEIRTGSRQLKDINYLTHAAPVTSDRLRYEQALLRDWLRKELREGAGS